ncbi:MAG: hypothetical protein LBC96_10220 [Lachnospiraceae bacterium]|nr:hypothetical protein [Lachnospiraceae bacterium]
MSETDERALVIIANLQSFSDRGITLYLNGKESNPVEIAECFVNEDTMYMPDYVIDETGTIREVRYDRVVYQ